MPKSCVIYTRVSTADQAAPGHFSLDAQESLCRKYAGSHDLHVLEVLRDEGYSGRTTKRPGMRRLVEYTGTTPPQRIHSVVVQDTSRVSRDTTEYLIFRRQLQERGIELVSVMQPNIDASPVGRLVDTVLAGVNQYQSEEKADRILIAMEKKFEQGQWPGRAPLGYLNVIEGERRYITTDPDRFDLIRLAFAEYATGHYTQSELGALLMKKGLRDRDGQPLSRTSLNKLLRNAFYWGRMTWNGETRMGTHTPATDRATWERCQAVTAEHNRYATRQRKHTFLLSGLLLCDECGEHLTQSVIARKKKRYYNCPSHAHCGQPYVPEDLLDGQVANVMSEIRLTDAAITKAMKQVRVLFESRRAFHERRRARLLRSKALEEQKRDACEQKLLAGILTDEAFKRLTAQIRSNLDEIHAKLEEIEAARRVNTDAVQEVLRFARDIPRAYANGPLQMKRQYLHFFFRAIVVRNRRIVRAVPSDLFSALLGEKQVQKTKNWWTRMNVNLTGFVQLFSDPRWVSKQRGVLQELGFAA